MEWYQYIDIIIIIANALHVANTRVAGVASKIAAIFACLMPVIPMCVTIRCLLSSINKLQVNSGKIIHIDSSTQDESVGAFN